MDYEVKMAYTNQKTVKIKASHAQIVVGGPKENPVYSILYFDTDKGQWYIGWSSSYLVYVQNWLQEEFEPGYKRISDFITDLLARAEAAEKRVEELEKSLSDAAQVVKTMQESTITFYERRAEKAQRERDAAVRHLSSLEVCGYCKNGQCTRRGGTKECKFEWVGSKED